MRDEEAIKEAFEAQAGYADESRELCDIFGLDPGGRHDDDVNLRRRGGFSDLHAVVSV